MEKWRIIEGTNGNYSVSNYGRVRRNAFTSNHTRKKSLVLKTRILRGYETIGLWYGDRQLTKPVHRLIAEAFILNEHDKPEVNHINGNKLDNRIENLEWVTKSENAIHAFSIGLRHKTCGGTSKPVVRIDMETGVELEVYKSLRELERTTDYLRKEVSLACRKERPYRGFLWRFV